MKWKCSKQIKIHRTCPGELDDAVKQLEELTDSVVISNIGRTVILYKPSLTKMKAEEKKKENMKIFMRRKLRRTTRPPLQVIKERRQNFLLLGFRSWLICCDNFAYWRTSLTVFECCRKMEQDQLFLAEEDGEAAGFRALNHHGGIASPSCV